MSTETRAKAVSSPNRGQIPSFVPQHVGLEANGFQHSTIPVKLHNQYHRFISLFNASQTGKHVFV